MSRRGIITAYNSILKRPSSSMRLSFIPHQHLLPHQINTRYYSSATGPGKNQQSTKSQLPSANMKITGPLVEMLARNSLFAQKYQSPPPLMEMVKGMRASGAGVVVLSCSDPRLNPYQILGIDPTLSMNYFHDARYLHQANKY